MIYTKDELSTMLDDFLSNSENTLEDWQKYLILAFVDNVQKQLLQQHHVSGSSSDEAVAAAWTYLAKRGIGATDMKNGDCFRAIDVLRAIQLASRVNCR